MFTKPLVAEAYKGPPPLKFGFNLQDSGDGTITDPGAGLMWVQADSDTGLKMFQLA